MNTITKNPKWPMIRVSYHGPRPSEIITVEEAMARYGLSEQDLRWVHSPYMSGSSLHSAPKPDHAVDMIHRYTEEDSFRDAGPELVRTLLEVRDVLVAAGYHRTTSVLGKVTDALKKARALNDEAEAQVDEIEVDENASNEDLERWSGMSVRAILRELRLRVQNGAGLPKEVYLEDGGKLRLNHFRGPRYHRYNKDGFQTDLYRISGGQK
jgi:hypothetical protein